MSVILTHSVTNQFSSTPHPTRSAADGELGVRPDLARLFSIDLRNLAALRMGIGVVILWDLFQRISTFDWFLTDKMFYPRELSMKIMPPAAGFWSLYWLGNSPGWAITLLIVNAIAAISLIVGLRTRLSAAFCLVLAWSLHMRMPWVLTAGDVLLRVLLVWLLFLPAGCVWSIDSRHRPQPTRHKVVSVATVAIMLQFVAMYIFSGIAKWNDTWLSGDAVYLAMQLDMYVKPVGRALLHWPQLCFLLSFATLLLELLGPLLLFMPLGNRFWRYAMLLAFGSLHLGIWLTMSIGIFSAVAMMGWFIFLPDDLWQCLQRKTGRRATSAAKPDTNEKDESLPNSTTVGYLPKPVSILCTLLLVYVVALNIANVNTTSSSRWFPNPLRVVGNVLMLTQQFKMFDRPSRWNYCWRLLGKDESGHWIDYFGGQHTRLAHPNAWPTHTAIYNSFPNQPWRRVWFNLAYYSDQAGGRDPLANEVKRRLGQCVAQQWAPPTTSAQQKPSVALVLFRRPISRWETDTTVSSEAWYSK